MKHTLFFIGTFMLIALTTVAQSHTAFKYQTVVRDAGGQILANQTISFRISILIGSASGDAIFVETHDAVNTNDFGLVNLEIGTGEFFSGVGLGEISWGNDNYYFIQIELDETGGTNYELMGASQLLQVPFALHARTADYALYDDDSDPTNELELPWNTSEGDLAFFSNGSWQSLSAGANGQVLTLCNGLPRWTTDQVCPPQIGDMYEGGIVFYVDASGHGLIAAPTDLAQAAWGCELMDLLSLPNIEPDPNNIPNPLSGPGAEVGDGQSNTNAIVSNCTQSGIAAQLCDDLELNGYNDWFLPSIKELDLMYTNLHLNGQGNFVNSTYWSSTEMNSIYAWEQYFGDGDQNFINKDNDYYVRAVRKF